MRPLSESASRVTSKNFSKKYIALGRIVNQWPSIIGEDFAEKAQPVKLHYRKKKKGQTIQLDISTSAAHATLLTYQKDLIRERINQIFGENWITDICFVVSQSQETSKKQKKAKAPLTLAEKNDLSKMLEEIADDEIKERLEQFGTAMMMDKKHES